MKNRKLFVSILAGIMAAILVLSLIISILPSVANAKSSSEYWQELQDLKEQKEEIDDKISGLQGQLSENLSEMEDMVNQKNLIDQEIFSLYQKIENINQQIALYTDLIADKQEELTAAEKNLADLNAKNKERIRTMEEEGAISYWSVLFKANSFADLLDRLNMVEEIAAADSRRLKEISDAAKVVAEAKEQMETERAALEATKEELKVSQTSLEEKRAEADKLLAQLVATGEEYQALLDEAEENANKLASDISQVESDYEDAKDRETQASRPPVYTGGNVDSNIVDGITWALPCNYTRFSSPFGYRTHPVYGDWRFHYGVDLAGPSGTPIVATRSGVVTMATYDWSAGYYVTIDHQDGFSSKYLHMTHYIVSAGQYVEQGQVIGYMGSTGTSTGSHLHFSILYNGSHVNPANFINI